MSKFASLMHIIYYYSTLGISHLFLLCQSTADLSQLTEFALSSFPLPNPFQCTIASPISCTTCLVQPIHPIWWRKHLYCPGLCFCNIKVDWQRISFILPQSFILGFWNQKYLHHFPNSEIIILPAGLWFNKEKLSDKEKAVLLKVVVIYIYTHTLSSLLSWWDHKHQHLTPIYPVHGPLPARYPWAEFSQADA